MKKILNSFILLGIATFFFACSAEDDLIVDWQASSQDPGVAPPPSGDAGSLDLSKYVSVGNSLTAGIADGALFPAGQANSYPSILATQFAFAGGASLIIPISFLVLLVLEGLVWTLMLRWPFCSSVREAWRMHLSLVR